MEISTMMQDLKQQMEHLQSDTEMVEQLAAKYREQLESAEKFIKESREQISYMQMTIDSMSVLVNMVGNKSESKPEIHESKPESKEKPPKPKVRPVYSRKPKAILRLDAHGNQVGYYRSVNECAKVLGWTNTGVTKTIEHISPEQQIRLKGFVLKYSA